MWRNSFVEATELKRMSSRSGGLVSPALMAQLEQLEAAQSASAVSRAWARALDGSFRVLELLGHPRLHISVRDSVALRAHTRTGSARHGTNTTIQHNAFVRLACHCRLDFVCTRCSTHRCNGYGCGTRPLYCTL